MFNHALFLSRREPSAIARREELAFDSYWRIRKRRYYYMLSLSLPSSSKSYVCQGKVRPNLVASVGILETPRSLPKESLIGTFHQLLNSASFMAEGRIVVDKKPRIGDHNGSIQGKIAWKVLAHRYTTSRANRSSGITTPQLPIKAEPATLPS